MSATDIEALMDDAMQDPALGQRFREDPEAVLDDYDLTDEERDALLGRDVNDIRYLLKDGEEATEATYRQAIIIT